MSEREGNGRGTRQAWVACNTPPSRKNEGTRREQNGNTAKRHGSMGVIQYSSELK